MESESEGKISAFKNRIVVYMSFIWSTLTVLLLPTYAHEWKTLAFHNPRFFKTGNEDDKTLGWKGTAI